MMQIILSTCMCVCTEGWGLCIGDKFKGINIYLFCMYVIGTMLILLSVFMNVDASHGSIHFAMF